MTRPVFARGVGTSPRGPEGPEGPASTVPGPPGYNATGAAEDQQTIANYIAKTAGPNPVADALSASYGRVQGTINRARRALMASPSTFKMLILGDSTATELNFSTPYTELRGVQASKGMPLEGVVGANILQGGSPGSTPATWLAGGTDFSTADYLAVAADLDLIVLRFGLNVFRFPSATVAQFITDATALVDYLHQHSPDADILFPTPNSFTSNVVGEDFLNGMTPTQAQAANDKMHAAVMSLRDRWSFVEVVDVMAEVYGTQVTATSPLMVDQLHPDNQEGGRAWARCIAQVVGDRRAVALAPVVGSFVRYLQLSEVVNANIIRLVRADPSQPPAPSSGIGIDDTMYLPGAGRVSLAGATFLRLTSDILQVSKTGAFTGAIAGGIVTVTGDHPGAGVQSGSIEVAVDCPSIAAGATTEVTIAVPGASYGCGLLVGIPFIENGLMAFARGTDTNQVKVRFHNTTGSAIDPSAQGWLFWVAR